MAIFRKIHVHFWSDVFIQSLTPEQKFFFLYLLTNERTKQCGIYEITTRQISYDTGYNVETISKLLLFFESAGKVLYSRETNEIAIKNWDRYNKSSSPKVKKLVSQEYASVKQRKLIEYIQETDTVSIQYKSGTALEVDPDKDPEQEREVSLPGNVFFSAEEVILKNQIEFERICMVTKNFDAVAAKEALRKFHLHLEEKDRYPQTKKQIFAGFEKWLMNEKKYSNGKQSTQSAGRVAPTDQL
jgi:hypothetical protein